MLFTDPTFLFLFLPVLLGLVLGAGRGLGLGSLIGLLWPGIYVVIATGTFFARLRGIAL